MVGMRVQAVDGRCVHVVAISVCMCVGFGSVVTCLCEFALDDRIQYCRVRLVRGGR